MRSEVFRVLPERIRKIRTDAEGEARALTPRQLLVDLACGRGGPGRWLARAANASLIGNRSCQAADQDRHRARCGALAFFPPFVLPAVGAVLVLAYTIIQRSQTSTSGRPGTRQWS